MSQNIPNDTVICISREYGSGGREIAETLAQKLNIPCYDKLLIQKAAKEENQAREKFLDMLNFSQKESGKIRKT